MTSIGNMRAAPSGGRYGWTVFRAALMGGVCGATLGSYQSGLSDSPWMAAGAAVAAIFAMYWTLAAMRMRKPLMARAAAANVRAAVAALPPLARQLLLPPPAKPSPVRPQAKPTDTKRTAERQVPPRPEPQGSIDAERARFSALGYSDAEISRILIERETGNAATRSSGFGSGAASGLLNNVDAVLHYLKGLVPSFKSDFERMFDESASKADRAGGAVSLALKAAAIGVVGYYLWIESIAFRGHALEEWSKGCLAAQDNAIKHATINQLFAGRHLAGDDCDPRPQ